jgi:hypothetical protein
MVDETAGLPSEDQTREEFNPETIVERHVAARETRGLSVDDGRDGMSDLLTHVLLATVDGETLGLVPDEWDDTNFVHWYRGITAEVAVTVPVLTLLGESETSATLDGWVPIDPVTARIIASEAKSFIRLLTHPETGAVLSVGRKRYKAPKDLRRYLQIRDLTCRFPGCGIAAQRSDINHTLDWQYQGETDHANLACLCPATTPSKATPHGP